MKYLNILFKIYGKWSVQTNEQRYTHVGNAVKLVGLAQARPNDNPFSVQGVLATCQGNVLQIIIYMLFSSTFGSLIANSKVSNSFTIVSPQNAILDRKS